MKLLNKTNVLFNVDQVTGNGFQIATSGQSRAVKTTAILPKS